MDESGYRRPPPFPTQWRHKNIFGVSFLRVDFVPAIEWAAQALLAGYTVFWEMRKRGVGFGWDLTDDIGDKVRWDLPDYLQLLRTRRVDVELYDLSTPDDVRARAADEAERREAYAAYRRTKMAASFRYP